jgi:uncharacterized protein (TIGR03790 family)
MGYLSKGRFPRPAIALPIFLTAASLLAQPSKVLVVYNSTASDSVDVANYYAAQRSIPGTNLCGITPSSQTDLTYTEYTGTIQPQIQACLNAAGPQNILYIVMSYLTPFRVASTTQFWALDSFIADIWNKYTTQLFTIPTAVHPYYADSQSEGDVYLPFVSFATWRAQPRSILIYSVWRLDAATKALAEGLVDKAIAAEKAGGPAGIGCFDLTAPVDPMSIPDVGGGNWDLERAAEFVASTGITVQKDTNATEFGTSPSGDCNGAALYSGWYSAGFNPDNIDNDDDALTFVQGAIGFHLDSSSLINPRVPGNWSEGAVEHGITVTSGSVTEPYLQGLPRPSGVFRNLLEGANVGDAFLRNTRWLKWMILNLGDPLYTPFPGGKAPFPNPPPVLSLSLSPKELVGGLRTATGTVKLPSPAPPSGLSVSLSVFCYLCSAATVPATVNVGGNSSQASFTITTSTANTYLNPVITANTGSAQISNTLLVDPLLSGVSLSQSSVTGGTPLTGQVVLNDFARPPGATVSLQSDNPAASVPAAVTVSSGKTNAVFPVSTTSVSSPTTINITASYAGASYTVKLQVTP